MKTTIQQLNIFVSLGAYPHERQQRPIQLDIAYRYNSTKAQRSDQLTDALDYTLIQKAIVKHFEHQHYQLIEHAAHTLMESLWQQFPFYELTVTLHKPQVPIPSATTSITYTRRNVKGYLHSLFNL